VDGGSNSAVPGGDRSPRGTWCGGDVLCFKFGLELVIPYSRNRTSDVGDCIAGLLNRLYMITVLI
jgi:hypothetical protein